MSESVSDDMPLSPEAGRNIFRGAVVVLGGLAVGFVGGVAELAVDLPPVAETVTKAVSWGGLAVGSLMMYGSLFRDMWRQGHGQS